MYSYVWHYLKTEWVIFVLYTSKRFVLHIVRGQFWGTNDVNIIPQCCIPHWKTHCISMTKMKSKLFRSRFPSRDSTRILWRTWTSVCRHNSFKYTLTRQIFIKWMHTHQVAIKHVRHVKKRKTKKQLRVMAFLVPQEHEANTMPIIPLIWNCLLASCSVLTNNGSHHCNAKLEAWFMQHESHSALHPFYSSCLRRLLNTVNSVASRQ